MMDQWVNHFSRNLCQYHPGRDILDTYVKMMIIMMTMVTVTVSNKTNDDNGDDDRWMIDGSLISHC